MKIKVTSTTLNYKNGYQNAPDGVIINFTLANMFGTTSAETSNVSLTTSFTDADDIETTEGLLTIIKAKLADKITNELIVFKLTGIDYRYTTGGTLDTVNIRAMFMSQEDPDNTLSVNFTRTMPVADFETASMASPEGIIADIETTFTTELASATV